MVFIKFSRSDAHQNDPKTMQSGKNSHLKNDPQTIKKFTILHEKPRKIQAWRHQNRGLEASWRCLGGVLGRLGSILGCLGRFRAVLRAS